MPDPGDPSFGGHPSGPRPHTGPEQWLGGPDPVLSFGNTVEQALQRLSIELAGLRAERDGMRLELEGLRTQLQIAQQQLADRDRFVDTVRELGTIVSQLSMPAYAPPQPYQPPQAYQPPAYAPPPYQPPAPPQGFVPPAGYDPYAPPPMPQAYVPPAPPPYQPPAPAPEAYVPPPPAPEPEPVAFVPPLAAPAPEAFVPPAPPPEAFAPTPPPAPPAPEPAAFAPEPEPTPEPIVLGAATPIVEAPAPAPEPAVAPTPPPPDPAEAYRRVDTSLDTRRENFFDQPGTWYEEPAAHERRIDKLKSWGSRIGTGIGAAVVLIVLLVSVGPKFLPYQTYFVRSGSMSPTFDTGDLIVLSKADAADLKKGDIITFDRPDKPGTLVTHRIFDVSTGENGRVFTTKGDANNDIDPWQVPASGEGWKYKTRLPKLGFVFGYLGTPQARLMLLAIPAVLLGILSLVDIWKPQSKATARRSR